MIKGTLKAISEREIIEGLFQHDCRVRDNTVVAQ